MAENQSTPNGHPLLQYPGWHNPYLSCSNPGNCNCDHDPVTNFYLLREIEHRSDPYIAKWHSGEWSEDQAKAATFEVWCDVRSRKRSELNRNWMSRKYTIVDDGVINWVCHPAHLTSEDLKDLGEMSEKVGIDSVITPSPIFEHAVMVWLFPTNTAAPLPHHPEMVGEKTWLYRMFDENGILLYIGISQDAFIRFTQHAKEKPWINDVAQWTRESYPSRKAALRAEKNAIKAECPLYNIAHNDQNGQEV